MNYTTRIAMHIGKRIPLACITNIEKKKQKEVFLLNVNIEKQCLLNFGIFSK
jgi:hypothetical protein